MGKNLEGLIAKLVRQRQGGTAVCDVSSSSVRLISAPVPAELALEMAALASVFQGSSECLAGELLSAAIADVWESLDDSQMLEATRACRLLLESGRPEAKPGVEFNVGGT